MTGNENLREQNLRIAQSQCLEARKGLLGHYITCGDCGKKVELIWAYRCYFCGIFFCEHCAGKHFGGSREEWNKKYFSKNEENA